MKSLPSFLPFSKILAKTVVYQVAHMVFSLMMFLRICLRVNSHKVTCESHAK